MTKSKEQALADGRRRYGNAGGVCGQTCPHNNGASYAGITCALPAGHSGYHRADTGMAWDDVTTLGRISNTAGPCTICGHDTPHNVDRNATKGDGPYRGCEECNCTWGTEVVRKPVQNAAALPAEARAARVARGAKAYGTMENVAEASCDSCGHPQSAHGTGCTVQGCECAQFKKA